MEVKEERWYNSRRYYTKAGTMIKLVEYEQAWSWEVRFDYEEVGQVGYAETSRFAKEAAIEYLSTFDKYC